ncbi:transmembrane protein 45B-like [Ptychodera flava]|uniref:transmembrane protein 45B-like n=1 Tax=Ptychodera flava TaxID=63121 RepID=UPI00396A503E
MGTFIGHISPGLAFITFGLLWAFQASFGLQREKYNNRLQADGRGRCMKILTSVPWEAVMKIFYGTLAALAEFFFPLGVNKLEMFKGGELQHPNEWQHFTMYSYFAMSGIVDVISQRVLKHRAEPLENFFLALAFGVETHLLYNHRHGKGMFENTIHILLVIASFGSFVGNLLRVWHVKDKLIPFLLAGFALLQGTWFFNAAFLIYREEWDADSHGSVMFVTMAYCWHIVLAIVTLASIYGLVYICFGRRWRKQHHTATSSPLQLNSHKNNNGLYRELETEKVFSETPDI